MFNPKIALKKINKLFENRFTKIREINKKYAQPRLAMSKSTKFGLLFLRIYLTIIIGLLVYKFLTLIQ